MAKLTEYLQIADKAKYFTNGDIRIVLNVDDIFQKLDEYKATGDFIFRGCSEAKFKIYNSLIFQRKLKKVTLQKIRF